MDGPRDYPTKWSKSDRDKYHMISLICGILKKNGTNENKMVQINIYKTDSQIQKTNLWLPKGCRGIN